MTKKAVKMLAVILLSLIVIATLSQTVFAVAGDLDIKQFDTYNDTTGASSSLSRIIGAAISMVQVVGVGVAIIMLVVLAIKYISAAPGDKADIKKHAIVYVVGAVVLFAATGILGIVKQFAGNIQ